MGVTEIRVLPIIIASSYPLIDLRSTGRKEDGNPRRRGDDPSRWLKLTDGARVSRRMYVREIFQLR